MKKVLRAISKAIIFAMAMTILAVVIFAIAAISQTVGGTELTLFAMAALLLVLFSILFYYLDDEEGPMTHKCPRCSSSDYITVGVDEWSPDDVTRYMACRECKLLFWFSSCLSKISTNGNDAKEEYLK